MSETAWPTGKTIRICVSDNLTGPYSQPCPSITESFREAPTLIPNRQGMRWLLYCERYPGIAYECFESSKLDGLWQKMEPASVAMTPEARHGAIIAITHDQYDVLQKAFGKTR